MKTILWILILVSIACSELFLPADTLIMSDRGVLVPLHIVSTTLTTQTCITKGYYGSISGQALINQTDTIIVQKGTLPFPTAGYHSWHKSNDSIWRDYFYYSPTGVKYLGTLVQSSSFGVYVNNSVSQDNINSWTFFNTYSRMGIHIADLYRSRLVSTKVMQYNRTVKILQPRGKRVFLLNGKSVVGYNKHNRVITY